MNSFEVAPSGFATFLTFNPKHWPYLPFPLLLGAITDGFFPCQSSCFAFFPSRNQNPAFFFFTQGKSLQAERAPWVPCELQSPRAFWASQKPSRFVGPSYGYFFDHGLRELMDIVSRVSTSSRTRPGLTFVMMDKLNRRRYFLVRPPPSFFFCRVLRPETLSETGLQVVCFSRWGIFNNGG